MIDGAALLIKRSRDRAGSTNQRLVAPRPGKREQEEREPGPRAKTRKKNKKRGGARGEREGKKREEKGKFASFSVARFESAER